VEYALLAATVAVHLGPLSSGALAALLAARTSRRFHRESDGLRTRTGLRTARQ